MNNKKNKTIEVPCLRLGEGNYSLGFREVADNPDGKPMIAIGVFKPDRKLVVGKPIPKDVKIPESPFCAIVFTTQLITKFFIARLVKSYNKTYKKNLKLVSVKKKAAK